MERGFYLKMPKVSVEHKNKVKETITQAAIKNFAKNGYANTKMDDIAKSADVSKGTLYLYFPSKEELFYEICKYAQQALIEERSALFKKKESLASDLANFYDNYNEATKENQKFRIEALSESIHNPKLRRILNQNKREFEESVTEFLKYMRKEGGFFQDKVDLAALSSGMIALYDGLYLSKIVGISHEENKDTWIKTMMAIFYGTGN